MTQQTTSGFVPQSSFFAGFPALYINNCQVSRAGNTTLTIQSGQVRDSTNTIDMFLGFYPDDSASTPVATTLNAAVNGVNGLDTGTFAATKLYHVFVIADATNNLVTGTLLSLSATAPTLPFGYSNFRKIGSWAVDGSTHFYIAYQVGASGGRAMTYDAPVSVLSGGAATSLTAVSLANVVPAVNNTPIRLNAAYTPNTAGNTAVLAPGASTSTTNVVLSGVVAAKAQDFGPFEMLSQLITGVPNVLYQVANGSDALSLSVQGYVESL